MNDLNQYLASFFVFFIPFAVSAQNEKGTYTSYSTLEKGICMRDYDHEVLNVAEIQPEPVGGYELWNNWIKVNNQYYIPDSSKISTGKVFIEFVVDENGKILDPCIVKKLGDPFDSEAIRLISECPVIWTPGSQHGKHVKVKISLPIHFSY